MTDEAFGDYMGEQISRILEFKERLEKEKGRSISLDEAARHWVRQYAERFREYYSEQSTEGSATTSD